MDTELEDRKKEGYPQSRQRQEEGTGAQEEAANTLLRAVCRRDREEEAIQQGVGHKGACETPSRLAWKTGEIPITLQWKPLNTHPQSQVWLALSGLELIQTSCQATLMLVVWFLAQRVPEYGARGI